MSLHALSTRTAGFLLLTLTLAFGLNPAHAQQTGRLVLDFDKGWHFHLGDVAGAEKPEQYDHDWRLLDLPHDWSIEGKFDKDAPAKTDGGALPGGIGWYRKTFNVPKYAGDKKVYIEFDGVYQKSDVWINGHHLGFRPNGYISFRYDMTPYLKFGGENVVAVKVDNSAQPNSRWYSGSGIYRNVRLVTTNTIAVEQWGTFITTPQISAASATAMLQVQVRNSTGKPQQITVNTTVADAAGKTISTSGSILNASGTIKTYISKNSKTPTPLGSYAKVYDSVTTITQNLKIAKPHLWSDVDPYLYKATTKVYAGKTLVDTYTTSFGIRSFKFDLDKGFFINGTSVKLRGVCDHHDLGCLGAALNERALERQLQILKAMGCNAIRTSHNPPAPELLDLCDRMGFFVMDEAFDVWQRGKEKYDYHLFFDQWHKRDLEDQVLRDRNHPSVIMWSIGNEIPEQGRPQAGTIARELAAIIHNLDKTRPLTAANNNPDTTNKIIQSGAVDLTGYNYHFRDYPKFHTRYPGKIFIGTETTSALETRGYYDMPAKPDSIRRWPPRGKTEEDRMKLMNADYTASAYDNVSAPWGSTHEESWKVIKKYEFLSGMFIWTGFDYIGEPTPYPWPAKSSYFGIVDLAGFPKDVYYMYQSEWTSKTVLHILPHWNWQAGKTVDVWAYYNNADEVELFLNGQSLGKRAKKDDDLHVSWSVPFQPGTLKAVSYKSGKIVATAEKRTAGAPSKLQLTADRSAIKADGKDLSFITVKVLDKDGNLVPDATNKISFVVSANGKLAGVDNGDPIDLDSFKADYRKAFHGLALAVVQAGSRSGNITITATAEGLPDAKLVVTAK